MNKNTSNQSQPEPQALLEESSAKAKSVKSRFASLLHAVAPKRTTAPQEKPAEPTSVRPVIAPDKAALFLDSKGNIVAAQPRCAEFFGRTPEEFSGLNIKALLKPGFDQQVTDVLAKGLQGSELSFHILALRKDGSEFPTQFAFKYLPEDFGFCWSVLVQAPPGFTGGSVQTAAKASESASAGDLKPMVPTTETATHTGTAQPASGEKPPARDVALLPRERLMAELRAFRNECKRLERLKLEADAASDKRLRQIQSEYGTRVIQLEQDLSAERQLTEKLSKKIEAQEHSLADQTKGFRKIKEQLSEPAAASDKAHAGFEDLQRRHQALESEAATLRKERDEFQNKLLVSQTAEQQAQSQIAELAAKIVRTSHELQSLRTGTGGNGDAQKQLATDLDKEREAGKLARQKAEELNAQLKSLRQASEQAEARMRESADRCDDWEKKAADLKKTIDELNRGRATEQTAGSQSARRVKELEQQLKVANDNLAAVKTELEKQNSARQRLEAENRSLTETGAKAKADLEKERESNKITRGDLEKKVPELKKAIEELTRNVAAEQSAGIQSVKRIKELEQQLKGANDNLAAGKTDFEKQNSARQRLETENRNLSEANAKAKADLDKERDAQKVSRQKMEELSTQLKNLQHAAEQAEARIRESAARSSDWEKKAADLKKTVDELTRSQAAQQSAAAQSAKRLKELEQQLKGANDNLSASKSEVEKQNSARQQLEVENRKLAESAKSLVALQKRAGELEQRVQEGVSALAKMTADFQNERAERERVEKCASTATAHLQQLNEKLNRHLESERANRAQIAELEKTIQDRGDALARASAALRKETKERHMAEKQSRLVSEMGARLESNLASLEDAKKSFEVALSQKEERLNTAERSLAKAKSGLEKESTERRSLEGLLAEAQRQLEKISGESRVELSRLRAALELGELQRKRMEGDLLRAREIATNAQQGQNAVLDSLRCDLRQPVEDLRLTACRLLEGHVTDEQKRAVETVLEKALFLQVTLNASPQPDSGSHSQAKAPRSDTPEKKTSDKKNGAK